MEPKPAAREVLELVEHLDRGYAEAWARHSARYELTGLYNDLAFFINPALGPDSVHVDLCTGTGRLLSEIVSRTTRSTTIGVDINPFTLALAARDLVGVGCEEVNLSHGYETIISGPPWSYRRVPTLEEDFRIRDDVPNLVLDDVRDLSAIKRYLQDRKATVVTHTFPGTSVTHKFEGKYKLDYDIAVAGQREGPEDVRRISENGRELRRAVFQGADELLKPGGVFMMADRVSLSQDPNPELAYSQFASGSRLQFRSWLSKRYVHDGNDRISLLGEGRKRREVEVLVVFYEKE